MVGEKYVMLFSPTGLVLPFLLSSVSEDGIPGTAETAGFDHSMGYGGLDEAGQKGQGVSTHAIFHCLIRIYIEMLKCTQKKKKFSLVVPLHVSCVQACPYFATRGLVEEADIVFCPYNYLIDPIIRDQVSPLASVWTDPIIRDWVRP